ncbi:unnamed protein product [Psylliodes chrysocephalus]|uniref:MADF domain-containing protein n=1 Tax=Psylliodes chrysocephalus TaxID=3402493 RepID=A0A9P0GET0_9CUCU|nr:unnamed protein product [Psylliodes chrysocephala]
MSLKWTEDTTVKFVKLYRDEECLWNLQLLIYRNKQAREAAIKKIVDAMGIEDFGPTEVKNKIKNLRSTYVQEVVKIKKSESSGAGADEIYRPKIKWCIVMYTILQKMDKKRETISNLGYQLLTDIDNDSQTSQDETERTLHEVPAEESEKEKFNIANEPTPKRQKIGKTNVKEIAAWVKDLTSLTISIQDMEPSENEFDIFGKSVAAQLKKLPRAKAITAQDQIQQLLSRFRLENTSSTIFFALTDGNTCT